MKTHVCIETITRKKCIDDSVPLIAKGEELTFKSTSSYGPSKKPYLAFQEYPGYMYAAECFAPIQPSLSSVLAKRMIKEQTEERADVIKTPQKELV